MSDNTTFLDRANHGVGRWVQQASVSRSLAKARKDPSFGVPLAGKRVLITGASSGIGEAAAYQFGQLGAHVILVARRQEELEAVAQKIRAAGGSAEAIPCDLRDYDAIDALTAQVEAEHGGVDVLINNAGHSICRRITESLERWHDFERVMQLNYFAAMRLTRGFLPGMLERRDGHVIDVVTGGLSQGAMPRFAAYGGSKAALALVNRTIGVELHGKGVHATTLYYPLVRTPMVTPTEALNDQPALTPEEAGEWMVLAARTRPIQIISRYTGPMTLLNSLAPETLNRLIGRRR